MTATKYMASYSRMADMTPQQRRAYAAGAANVDQAAKWVAHLNTADLRSARLALEALVRS